jgi:DNA-binding transcriptional LysR family regulator
MVTVKSLEIFYWAAQLTSFSRAAEKLNTTQPTVSQRISALEAELGRQLISRTTKPVSLTPDGRAAFQHAELILRQISRLKQEFNAPSRVRSTIRLGVSETIVHTWLNRFLEASHQIFPNVDFDISVDITAAMMKSLSDGEIDLAFMLGPAMIEGLQSRHLLDYPLRFYAAPGIVAGNHLDLQNMRQLPILTYPRHAYPYSHLRELLLSRAVERPRIFTNSSLSTIERMAIDRIGVALVAEGVFSPSLEQNKLVALTSDLDLPPLRFFSYYMMGLGSEVLEKLTAIAVKVAL